MKVQNFLKKIGLEMPLIVAPMAGGPSSPELVAASAEAGALGSIGSAYSKPLEIDEFFRKVRIQSSKPLAINLFIPDEQPKISKDQLSKALMATAGFRNELGLPEPTLTPPFEEDFDAQFETVLKLKPEVFSFVFGLLKPEYVKAAHEKNIYLIGTATTLDEAQALQESGVDAVTLQGVEAGGHRGIFNAESLDPNLGIVELLKKCVPQIQIPLIAAGGIMNSQDIQQMLTLGASAVQMGTAFLMCEEAGTSVAYREALSGAKRKTKTTRAFSGRLARGIENRFMLEMDRNPESILKFPAQNKLTRDVRTASAQQRKKDFLSLWSGTGAGDLWEGSARELILQLFPR